MPIINGRIYNASLELLKHSGENTIGHKVNNKICKPNNFMTNLSFVSFKEYPINKYNIGHTIPKTYGGGLCGTETPESLPTEHTIEAPKPNKPGKNNLTSILY
jgi:hypothetical protein